MEESCWQDVTATGRSDHEVVPNKDCRPNASDRDASCRAMALFATSPQVRSMIYSSDKDAECESRMVVVPIVSDLQSSLRLRQRNIV
eukprot:scaffold26047_cov55-Attheya_sp.AAC.2